MEEKNYLKLIKLSWQFLQIKIQLQNIVSYPGIAAAYYIGEKTRPRINTYSYHGQMLLYYSST